MMEVRASTEEFGVGREAFIPQQTQSHAWVPTLTRTDPLWGFKKILEQGQDFLIQNTRKYFYIL